ncbi:MAG: transporter associated domain-containing protein, partial [Pseudomonadota bacterium]
HLRDLLPFWGDGTAFQLAALVRDVLVVPPSMRVIDLLLEMRATHNHVAVVVDEFGGTDGLVTIEDLAEEIVGEIHDEQQKLQTPRIVENEDGSLDADGRVFLEDLEERLDLKLLSETERDEADTLGGLIFTLVDRVPARGELVSHPAGLQFEIVDADPRRINRVRIRPSAVGAVANADGSGG